MKKYILIACVFCFSISFAQDQKDKNFIDADNLSEDQLANLANTAPKNGWVLLKYKGENHIVNYSNKEYTLWMSAKCSKTSQQPSYLIEFSNNYGDKEMGGIDFISSKGNQHAKTIFYLDGKDFENPFLKAKNKNYNVFYEALKAAKVLKIEVYDNEFDPETGKDAIKLNRSVAFKLGNGQLLDTAVNCKDDSQ